MNPNFPGSLMDRKINISSSVSVATASGSEMFNGLTILIPASFSEANLAGFDKSVVEAKKPALVVATVDNYRDVMQGDLLSQYEGIFNQDTNSDVVLYLVVFLDGDTTEADWVITTKSITFAPLTDAFKKVYFVSYLKALFDPTYSGADIVTAATKAKARLTFHNPTAAIIALAAGTYSFTVAARVWNFTITADQSIPASGGSYGPVIAETVTTGVGGGLVVGTPIDPATVSPVITGLTVAVNTFTDGAAGSTRTSRYFDTALALAYQVKSNISLSALWLIAKVNLTLVGTTDTNKCWIRSVMKTGQIAAMTSLITGDRSKYFYGALALMGAANTVLTIDTEDRNIFAIAMSSWFTQTNESGEYVGNKLSLLRLSSQKAFGLPSFLDASVNANDDKDWLDNFDAENVGYAASISGSASGDSYLSSCRTITGVPLNALMIAKYTDYQSRQDIADMITDKGTVTNPVLTNEETYKKIQNTVAGNLQRFVPTKRITNIVMQFPSFSVAKTGLTSLEASSAWTARYTDDLDTVIISGGIVAE